MQIHCRCGQPFTPPLVHFPHVVCCHVCGHKFIVQENGATEEITTDPVQATCRCGKIYLVRHGPFPRDLHCLECNRKFSVLSTGEIFDLLDEPVVMASSAFQSAAPAPPSAHIQTSPGHASSTDATHAFVDETTKDLLAAAAGLPNADLLERELKIIDMEWEAEQYQACVARVFGHMVMASPTLVIGSGIFGFFLLILSSLVTIVSIVVRPLAAAYVAQVGIVASAGLVIYVVAKSQGMVRLEKAEREWRRKRQAAIAKFSPWAHLLPASDADAPSD